jgi:hypothetical protein
VRRHDICSSYGDAQARLASAPRNPAAVDQACRSTNGGTLAAQRNIQRLATVQRRAARSIALAPRWRLLPRLYLAPGIMRWLRHCLQPVASRAHHFCAARGVAHSNNESVKIEIISKRRKAW